MHIASWTAHANIAIYHQWWTGHWKIGKFPGGEGSPGHNIKASTQVFPFVAWLLNHFIDRVERSEYVTETNIYGM